MGRYLIYGLTDPRTGHLRYVGKSSSGLRRPQEHGKSSQLRGVTKKNSWIKSLLARGLAYGIEVLEERAEPESLDDAERFWIASMRATGAELLNMTDGGDGQTRGMKDSEETRKKKIAKLTGRPVSEATRQKLSRSNLGKRHRPHGPQTREHRLHLAAANKGRPFLDELGNRWDLLSDAASFWGMRVCEVCNVLKGRRLSSQGHCFRYEDEKPRRTAPKPRSLRPVIDSLGRRFPSAVAASRALGIANGNLCSVLRGKRARAGGLAFTYAV